MRRHAAWPERKPEWVTLAPGVKWLLTRPDGAVQSMVQAEVGAVMGRVFKGAAALEELGLDPEQDMGGALDLEKIAGYSAVLTACRYAARCLSGWEGIDDPEAGQPLDHTDPEAIRSALIDGPPGDPDFPLLTPFLAWLDGPRRPIAAEAFRLRQRARDYWKGGADRCGACRDAGDSCAKGGSVDGRVCPQLEHAPETAEGLTAWEIVAGSSGLWARAGMDGFVIGLDYRAALLAIETRLGESCDHGAAFKVLQAIEQGRLEAQAAKQAEDAAARDLKDG